MILTNFKVGKLDYAEVRIRPASSELEKVNQPYWELKQNIDAGRGPVIFVAYAFIRESERGVAL